MGRKREDLVGQIFNKLQVIGPYAHTGKKPVWLCKCECGNILPVSACELKRSVNNPERCGTKSCGCLISEATTARNTKHGLCGTPEYRMWASARSRARRKGLPFDIEPIDIEIPESCPLLEIPITHGERGNSSGPSIDRIVPSLGYIKGNIWVISRRANMIKSNASFEEFRKIAKNLDKIVN